MSLSDAHYGGGIVSGGRLLELLSDVATELCIRAQGDEGLFAGYAEVRFVSPCRAGDLIEAAGEITRVGNTSLDMSFTIHAYGGLRPDLSESAADLYDAPRLVLEARGTCVVPQDKKRKS
jgi:3-aminobutyryl-CoA ammonia-lyase